MTDEQLEEIILYWQSRRWRENKSYCMRDVAQVDVADAKEGSSGAVGPLLSLKVKTEGVEVDAMIDTGLQSTVISHLMLHR